MAKTKIRRTPAERTALLKSIQADVARGTSIRKACKAGKITPVTYYQWLKNAGTPASKRGGRAGAGTAIAAASKAATARFKRGGKRRGGGVGQSQDLGLKLSTGMKEGHVLVAMGDPVEVRKVLALLSAAGLKR